MTILFQCPSCGTRLKVGQERVGEEVLSGTCSAVFRIRERRGSYTVELKQHGSLLTADAGTLNVPEPSPAPLHEPEKRMPGRWWRWLIGLGLGFFITQHYCSEKPKPDRPLPISIIPPAQAPAPQVPHYPTKELLLQEMTRKAIEEDLQRQQERESACRYCGGSGHGLFGCRSCNATGQVGRLRCRVCNGSGQVEQTCPGCNGTGRGPKSIRK